VGVNVTRSTDNRRQEWFDRGVQAFTAARPGAPSLYCCPLCIRGFHTVHPDVLSLEDVPPRSIGGKPLLLTCRECNNKHGTDLDSHMKAGRDLEQILEGAQETWGRLRVGGDRMTVKGTIGETYALAEMAGKSNPPERNAVEAYLDRLTTADAAGTEFHFEFSLRHDEWRERVAWLRVAYLYLTALLGYTFVLREVMNPIREQFFRPDEQLVPKIIKTMVDPIPPDCIVSVSLPVELRSFVVKLQRWMFFFPGFINSDSFYDRLAALPEKGRLSVTGKQLVFPTEPMFLCDFDPEFAKYLAAGQAGMRS
jgi:hypothetical protein